LKAECGVGQLGFNCKFSWVVGGLVDELMKFTVKAAVFPVTLSKNADHSLARYAFFSSI
jgi:hypothetical protein